MGFMLSHQGIQANLDKCQVVIDVQSPRALKEIKKLIGRIASLIRLLPWIVEKLKPIMNLLKKTKTFRWDQECEKVFKNLKLTLATPLGLAKLDAQKKLIIYLSIFDEAVSVVTIQEQKGN